MRSKMWRSDSGSVARKNSPPVRSAIRFSRPSSICTSVITVCLRTGPVNGSCTCTGIGTGRRGRPGSCRRAPPSPSPGRRRSPGSISPALLAPSVTSTMTRLFACERRRRVSEVARPEPIAVPSGSISSFTSSSCRSSTAVSVVGGDLVRLRPANTTRPTPVALAARRRTRPPPPSPPPAGSSAGSPRRPSSPTRRARRRCRRPAS